MRGQIWNLLGSLILLGGCILSTPGSAAAEWTRFGAAEKLESETLGGNPGGAAVPDGPNGEERLLLPHYYPSLTYQLRSGGDDSLQVSLLGDFNAVRFPFAFHPGDYLGTGRIEVFAQRAESNDRFLLMDSTSDEFERLPISPPIETFQWGFKVRLFPSDRDQIMAVVPPNSNPLIQPTFTQLRVFDFRLEDQVVRPRFITSIELDTLTVATADIERDGITEVVLVNRQGSVLIGRFNVSNGRLDLQLIHTASTLDRVTGQLVAADLTGNGVQEILAGSTALILNRDSGNWEALPIVDSPLAAAPIRQSQPCTVEINGDNRQEIIVQTDGISTLLEWGSVEGGQLRLNPVLTMETGRLNSFSFFSPRYVSTVDFDGDGVRDIVYGRPRSTVLSDIHVRRQFPGFEVQNRALVLEAGDKSTAPLPGDRAQVRFALRSTTGNAGQVDARVRVESSAGDQLGQWRPVSWSAQGETETAVDFAMPMQATPDETQRIILELRTNRGRVIPVQQINRRYPTGILQASGRALAWERILGRQNYFGGLFGTADVNADGVIDAADLAY